MSESLAMQSGALAGLRVIELGEGVSAPFCARLFADYGADVVKVERPGSGDVTRYWGPFPGDRPNAEKSGLFFFLNTNKRGVIADLDDKDGRARILALIERADVLVENNSPSWMRERGLDYRSLARVNPRLVMISITPFGQTGPYADWKGSDLNAYHLSAAGSRYCGDPERAPLEPGTFAADFFAGYTGAAWGAGALYGRERSGGRHLDVSSAEAIAALFVGAQNIGGYAQDGRFETRTGVGMPLGAPATILPCRDGHVWMMALEPGQWDGLRAAMGDPEWARLEMFRDMFVRARNAGAIYPLIEQWTRLHDKQEIMDLCQAAGCPTTAVYTVAEVVEHPHLAARSYFVEMEHAALGKIKTMGAPVRLPACPGGPRRPAPLLGEHDGDIRGGADTRPGRETLGGGGEPTPPLAGIRVANFGWGWLGPVAGQTLAWLGADVIKIESRARLDINRTLPPFAEGVRDPDRSLQNHAGWAGNGSVTLNLKLPAGRDLARRLVSHCDVVLENFGPGVMPRLGLAYEELRGVRSDVVMVSMPAAGLSGPLAGVRAYGMSLSSITGLDSLTGYCGGPPVPMENAFPDPLGGVVAAFGALLALHHRRRGGEGQHVDFSQQEGMLQLLAPAFMDYVLNGRVGGPLGNRHPLAAAAPHGVFPCAGEDQWISIAVASDDQWRALVDVMGSPVWAGAAELAATAGRVARIESLHASLAEWTRAHDKRTLAERLQRCGVAAVPVSNVADLLDDPHFRTRCTFVEVRHPLGFTETIYGAYVKDSGVSPPPRPGPTLGQDNDRVFRDLLQIPAAEYRRLREQRVIY